VTSKLRSAALILLALGACKSAPVEQAPVAGGETLTYVGEGTRGVITIEKSAEGFILKTDHGEPPQPVAANLRDGRAPVAAIDLGLLWLEPSQRHLGGQVPLGNVVSEETRVGRPCWKVSERNGHIERWFEKQTGFLVEKRTNPAGPTVQLQASTVPGL
jgi:hypothetical protein